ncbi:MAG: HEAT repeat domain-containing protein [Armatimonadota bacterium]
MKSIARYTIALFMIGGLAATAHAQAVDGWIEQLKDDDAQVREQAADGLALRGAEAIGPLFAVMGGTDHRLDLAARIATKRLVHHAARPAGSPIQRQAVAEALAQEAQANHPVGVRRFALRMVSFVGGDSVVPALGSLLDDQDVREMARWALCRIPGEEALRALAAGLPQADPDFKVALIAALGIRRDPAAIPVLKGALGNRNTAVRLAALDALGHIPDPSLEPTLREATATGSDREKEQARAAYLRLGHSLLDAGDKTTARNVFRYLYQNASTEHERCAGLAGLAKIGGQEGFTVLLAALDSEERDIQGVAKQGLVEAPGSAVTQALANALEGADAAKRVLVLWALGERGDPAGVPAVLAAAKDDEEAVQVAAFEALGKLGDPAAAPVLIAALSEAQDQGKQAAEVALNRIPGSETTQAIIRAVPSAAPDVQVILLRALGGRRDPSALPVLAQATKDDDEAVRVAALEAIGHLRDPQAVPVLLAALHTAQGKDREAAEAALGRMRGEETKTALVQALDDAPEAMQASLLRVLARLEDKELVPVFASAARSNSEEVVVAALEALGRLRDESAAPVFLEIAEQGTEKTKAAAIKAYMQIASAREKEDGAAALSIYRKALGLATTDDVRRQAIQGIGRLGGPDDVPLIRPYLQQQKLRQAAAAAIVPLAAKLADAGQKDEAIALLRLAVESTSDRNVLRDAAGKLRDLGVELDLAREGGFLTHWWVLGPFPGKEEMDKNDVIPTDQPIDVSTPAQVDGKDFDWKYAPIDDPLGMMDLEATVARRSNVGAYAYAEVQSPAAQDVTFKFGSDDSVFCWLNGQQIHAWVGSRGWGADQDSKDTSLKAGTNTILLKVVNGGGQWAFSLRVTDRNGKPLLLEQRKP